MAFGYPGDGIPNQILNYSVSKENVDFLNTKYNIKKSTFSLEII